MEPFSRDSAVTAQPPEGGALPAWIPGGTGCVANTTQSAKALIEIETGLI